MARGVYYQCDFCDKVELVEIHETVDGIKADDVFPKFQKLPKGWGVMEVPYFDFAEQVWWSKTAHFCGVECAISYLEELKTEQEAESEAFANELEASGK
ncbi:MAG: hypothetical protein C0P72_006690 [Clostridia bacterium]